MKKKKKDIAVPLFNALHMIILTENNNKFNNNNHNKKDRK